MLTLKKLFATLTIILFISINAKAVDEIVITFNNTNLCASSAYDITYTSTLPAGTMYKLQLFKGGVEINMRESTSNPFVYTIPYEAFYGTDYSIKLSAGVMESALLDNITIGNVSNLSVKDQHGFYLNNYNLCAGSVIDINLTLSRNSNYSQGNPATGPFTYQWQKNDVDINNTTNSISLSEIGTYKLKITQNNCTATRQTTISTTTQEGTYLNNFGPQSYCEGSEVKILPAYASNNSTFQWQKNSIDIPGATNRAYFATNAGNYSVKVNNSNCAGQMNLGTAKISFSNSLPALLDKNDNVLCGTDPSKNNVYLNIGIDTYGYYAGPEYPFSTIFQKNGVDIPTSLNLGYLRVNEPGTYRLKVSQGNCISYSSNQEVKLESKFSKPTFNENIGTTSICDGNFSLYWNSQGNVYKNNTLIETNKYGINTNQSGTYKLIRGEGTSCAVESDPITISVGTALVPVIKASKTELCGLNDFAWLGMQSNFNSSNISYQWQKDGVDIPNFTNPVIARYSYEPLGTFRLKVTNGSCTEFSNAINLSLPASKSFNLATNLGESQILGCSNRFITIAEEVANFNATNGEYSSPNNQWYKNEVLLQGQNGNKFNATEAGTYKLVINGNGCTATSNNFIIQSDFVPNPSITQTYTTTGSSSTLNAYGCAGTVRWWASQTATTPLNTGTTFTTQILNVSTDYFASCATANCESARTKRTILLDQVTDQISFSLANTTLCAGATISVPYTTTFSSGTIHKIQLLKNGIEVANIESSVNPITIFVPPTAIYGTDYSLKISAFGIESNSVAVTILNPTVTQSAVFQGLSGGVLTASGCGTAQVIWEIAPNTINTNNPYNLPALNGPTSYKVFCNTASCQTAKVNYNVVFSTPELNITNYPTNLCAGTNYSISVSTNLPASTYFGVFLIAPNGQSYQSGTGQIVNGQLNLNANQYSIIAGINYKIRLATLTFSLTNIETETTNDITVGNFTNTSFLDLDGSYLGGFKTFCTGTTANLGAQIAYGNGRIAFETINDMSFQWQKDNVNIGTNQNPISISEAGNYKVIAQMGGCTAISQNIQVQYGNSIGASLFPYASNYCENTAVKIFTDYTTSTATYQWKLNDINISGATNREYYPTVSGQYKVSITDKTCSINLGTKTIQFSDALPAQLTTNSLVICNGASVNLQANTFDGNGAMYNAYGTNIIWQKDGVNIPNQNSLYFSAGTPGTYRYKIIQGTCTSHSREVQVINGSQWEKPTIQNVLNTGTCLGYFPLNWGAYGTVYKDNVAIAQNVNNYNATQSGVYKLVMGEGNSCASTSDEVTVTIGSLNPKIESYRTVLCGLADQILLFYNNQAQYNSSYSYQWQRDGSNMLNGNTTAIQITEPGTYKVRVTNGACIEFSNEIVITNNNNMSFDLKSQNFEPLGSSQNLNCTNRLTLIQSDFLNNFNLSVSWYRNGVQIPNVSKSYLYTPQAGTYTATATGNGCTATSYPFVINSDYVPQPNLGQSITYINTSASLEATGCNGTVNWFDSQTSTTSLGTGPTFNTPNLSTGLPYFADCTSPTCKSAREKIDVVVEPCSQMITVKSGNWDDPTVWSCNRIPYDLESVIIYTGHSVLIPENYTAKVKDIINNGSIVISENGNLQFKTN